MSFWTRGVAMPADEGSSMDFMQAKSVCFLKREGSNMDEVKFWLTLAEGEE